MIFLGFHQLSRQVSRAGPQKIGVAAWAGFEVGELGEMLDTLWSTNIAIENGHL